MIKQDEKIDYIFRLKAISVLVVILIHTIGPYFYLLNKISREAWMTVTIIDSFVRFCVPIFLVCSGAIILNKDYKISKWITDKVIYRLTIPFLLYSLILAIISHGNIIVFIKNILEIKSYLPFYTVIMSLYLLYPVIRSWLKKTEDKYIKYFILLWVVVLLIRFYFPKFPYISGNLLYEYIGYPVIGYFLTKINTKKYKRIAILLYFFSSILIALITLNLSFDKNQPIERYFEYTSPLVVLMTIGIFIFIKESEFKINKKIDFFVKFLSDSSWGMYLLHPIILQIISPYFWGYSIYISIILKFFLTLILTTTILFVTKKIPLLKKIVG